MTKWTIEELAYAKGTSEPVRQALLAMQAKLEKMEQSTIEFKTPHEWVMRITANRRIEVNEGVTVTEAAQHVLDALQTLLKQQKPWVGLEAEDLAQIESDEFWSTGNHMAIALAVEAKLKEKNHDQ